jgi:hypothetical protein
MHGREAALEQEGAQVGRLVFVALHEHQEVIRPAGERPLE